LADIIKKSSAILHNTELFRGLNRIGKQFIMIKVITHPITILLSLLLFFAGCKESEETIIEVPKEEKVVKVEIKQVEVSEKEPPLKLPDELIEPDINPNKTVMENSSDKNSPSSSGFIIRPDTSKDHKIIIIPADPNIDPGIFDLKSFNNGRRKYKRK